MPKKKKTKPSKKIVKKAKAKTEVPELFTLFPDYRKKQYLEGVAQQTDQYIHELSDAYRHKGLVLYLGAGVSMSIGLPSWPELIRSLTVAMMTDKVRSAIESLSHIKEEKRLDALWRIQEDFEKQADSEKPILVMARSIKDELTDKLATAIARLLYWRVIRRRAYLLRRFRSGSFRSRAHKAPVGADWQIPSSELLDSVVDLARAEREVHGVQAIINYNFDDLVDEKLREEKVRCQTVRSGKDRVPPGVLPCYHVHGVIPFRQYLGERKISRASTGNFVFSEDEYHEEYSDAYKWSNMTQVNFLGRYTGLFLGLSMDDPNLRRLIDVTHRQYPEIKNYAILRRRRSLSRSSDSNNTVQRNLFERVQSESFLKIGVRVIWVDSFDEITELIKGICGI